MASNGSGYMSDNDKLDMLSDDNDLADVGNVDISAARGCIKAGGNYSY